MLARTIPPCADYRVSPVGRCSPAPGNGEGTACAAHVSPCSALCRPLPERGLRGSVKLPCPHFRSSSNLCFNHSPSKILSGRRFHGHSYGLIPFRVPYQIFEFLPIFKTFIMKLCGWHKLIARSPQCHCRDL